MPIWKLVPINQTDPNWEASTHKGSVIVRAATEKAARERAQLAFTIATQVRPGEATKITPWKYGDLVDGHTITDSRYPEDGPEEILEPEHGESEIRR